MCHTRLIYPILTLMLKRAKIIWKNSRKKVLEHPLKAFLIALILLLGLIVLGHILRQPQVPEIDGTKAPKASRVFIPSQHSATFPVPAQVKKSHLIHVTAITPGIVSRIPVVPGKKIVAGQTIVEMSDDYGSGIAGLERTRAQENYRLTQELSAIDKRIQDLEERKIRRDSSLSKLEEAIALRELKKERATLRSGLETSRLDLALTERSTAALRPKALISGIVESITVTPGQYVTPGTVLATIRGEGEAIIFEAYVNQEVHALLNFTAPGFVDIDGQRIEASPRYLAQGENEKGLFTLLYVPSEKIRRTEGSLVELRLPLKAQHEDGVLLPIEAIFQDTAKTWVLVETNGKAENKEIALGNLYGSFAEVFGLAPESKVLLERSIIAGDEVDIRL